jgi:hypothetical protein
MNEEDEENKLYSKAYLGVSKSSSNDILVSRSKLDKSFFLHRMIEKKMLLLSILFDHTLIDIITIKS